MKIKNKLLIFLGIFIFMIIPKNVFAAERLPSQAIINNTFFIAQNQASGSIINTTINGNSYLDFSISITTYTDQTFGIESSIDFVNYPYVWLFFEMYNSQEQIVISRNSSCNSSCFNGNNMILKQIGVNPSNNRKRYVLVLPVLKYETPSINPNMGDGEMHMGDVLRFENLSSSDRRFTITNLLVSDSMDINSITSYDDIINNATTNTNNMIASINGVNTAINNMQTAITSSITSTNSALQDMTNMDISSSDKQNPNTTDFNNYKSSENDLFNKMDNADIDDMQIAIDSNSSTWVWARITEWLNSNGLIMSFLISILSIGIIKMALGR